MNANIGQIYSDYRVYDFLLPAVQDVVEVDSITNVKLPALATAIAGLTGKENSSNQGVLAPLVSNMQSQSSTATSAMSGLSAQLLGFTVAEWNSNHGLLNGARTELFIANKALGTAWKDNQKANDIPPPTSRWQWYKHDHGVDNDNRLIGRMYLPQHR